MLTSMFRKMFTAYVAVMLVAFSLLTFVAHMEIKRSLTAQRLDVLNQEAQDILPIIERVNGNPRYVPAYDNVVNRFKRVDNVTVNLLLVKNSNLQKMNRLTSQFVRHDELLNEQAVRKVLSGSSIEFVGPFSTTIRSSTLIVGLPILSDGVVIGAIFLHTPVQELRIGQVTRIIILLAIPILILSFILLYLTSRRFSKPLLHMSNVVHSFGNGHFERRVQVDGRDEIGQLATAFNEMADRLDGLETMRKDLIAHVSHEIRTPLTSVRGFIQGILDGVIPKAEEKQYLETAKLELERLSTLLNRMLDLSAIETGHISIESDVVAWTDVLETVAERLGGRIRRKGISFDIRTGDETVTVWGDRDRLIQVLFNLVDNAIRHTESGEIAIISHVANHQLHICVTDTGEGISPEMLPHIWERFYTGSVGVQEQPRSGLGLTITKSLVELMNGSIRVESTLGVGTTFHVYLPVFSAVTYS